MLERVFGSVAGSFAVVVSEPRRFVQSAQVWLALRKSISILAGVPLSYTRVELRELPRRRLGAGGAAEARGLQGEPPRVAEIPDEANAQVNYNIVLPGDPEQANAFNISGYDVMASLLTWTHSDIALMLSSEVNSAASLRFEVIQIAGVYGPVLSRVTMGNSRTTSTTKTTGSGIVLQAKRTRTMPTGVVVSAATVFVAFMMGSCCAMLGYRVYTQTWQRFNYA